MTLQHEAEIAAYEKSHPAVPQMFESVDFYKAPK
jgi:hypothetical protein